MSSGSADKDKLLEAMDDEQKYSFFCKRLVRVALIQSFLIPLCVVAVFCTVYWVPQNLSFLAIIVLMLLVVGICYLFSEVIALRRRIKLLRQNGVGIEYDEQNLIIDTDSDTDSDDE